MGEDFKIPTQGEVSLALDMTDSKERACEVKDLQAFDSLEAALERWEKVKETQEYVSELVPASELSILNDKHWRNTGSPMSGIITKFRSWEEGHKKDKYTEIITIGNSTWLLTQEIFPSAQGFYKFTCYEVKEKKGADAGAPVAATGGDAPEVK